MKLSVFTDEISPDSPERAIALAREWGIDYLEVRLLSGGRFPDVPDGELQRFSRQIADAGLAVSGVSPGFFKCRWDDPVVDQGLTDSLPRACEWAKKLGTDLVTCFGFHRGPAEQQPPAVVELLGRMAEAVRSHGCRLALENEAVCWGATGLEAADIIRQVGGDLTSLCWDPGNAFRAGAARPFPDEYEQVKDLVSHVHMKNYDPGSGSWSLIAEGAVDWPGQLAGLSRDGYDGFLVIETHLHISPDAFRFVEGPLSGLERNTLRNVRFVRACLKEVQHGSSSTPSRDEGEAE